MAMLGEAAVCESPSRLFRGACFSNRNCASICGECKFLKCKCTKDCSGGGQGPPNEGPPNNPGSPPEGGDGGPPSEGPPNEGTPDAPTNGPPSEDPPQGPPNEGTPDAPDPAPSSACPPKRN